jgi:aspartyl aminopeptidase
MLFQSFQQIEHFNESLLAFLEASPTPFHATLEMARALEKAGFEYLDESTEWALKPGGQYYTTRNGSSLIAFRLGNAPLVETGFSMIGTHTDSPCLKVKPQPDQVSHGVAQLGVEVYGGALLNPWFDRDLSLAGRVHALNEAGTLTSYLIDIKRPIAFIPSLAIHLDREANKNRTVNPQTQLPPVLFLTPDQALESVSDYENFRLWLTQQLKQQGDQVTEVLDYEMLLYDVQKPALIGLHQDFIVSARLDNLLSCFIALRSLIDAKGKSALISCHDHEEVGSASACGAQGPFLQNVIERIESDPESRVRLIQRSMMISADNAHAIHPNHADLHDGQHGPKLNLGPVIKTNANQRYATNSETSARFRQLCQQAKVPVQDFVTRSDLGCGSTIGPISASQLGVPTLDVGIPQWGMHSCRELCGSLDPHRLYQVLGLYCSQ